MRLPNPEQAIVDIAKLRDYCLSMDHPRGRHKARVFAAAAGLTRQDAKLLQDALLAAAHFDGAVAAEKDEYGQRYELDFDLDTPAAKVRVRSCWIVRANEDFPRLTSCYVL